MWTELGLCSDKNFTKYISASCSFCAKQNSGERKVREGLAFRIDLIRCWLKAFHWKDPKTMASLGTIQVEKTLLENQDDQFG